LHASAKVDINVKAGGDVFVYGNPAEVTKNTLAGGRIYIESHKLFTIKKPGDKPGFFVCLRNYFLKIKRVMNIP
jgi:hypothetical protein